MIPNTSHSNKRSFRYKRIYIQKKYFFISFFYVYKKYFILSGQQSYFKYFKNNCKIILHMFYPYLNAHNELFYYIVQQKFITKF